MPLFSPVTRSRLLIGGGLLVLAWLLWPRKALAAGAGQAFLARHTVQAGDTLSALAQAAYGQQNLWPVILDVNRQALNDDPDVLQPGTVLLIPDVSKLSQAYLEQVTERAREHARIWRVWKAQGRRGRPSLPQNVLYPHAPSPGGG